MDLMAIVEDIEIFDAVFTVCWAIPADCELSFLLHVYA